MTPTSRSVGAVIALAALTLGCAGDGKTLREPVFDPPQPVASTVPPTTVPPTIANAPASSPARVTVGVDRLIEFDRLYSPENATAEITGFGAIPTDLVTVDDDPADVLSFDADSETGSFVARVRIEDEGAHTVCVGDTCGRVHTLAADAETAEEVVAKIEQAIPIATEIVGSANEFPARSISIGGALSGTGGTTDVATRTLVIYRNRGRSVDDFVRTILHEFGHTADDERLDDVERSRYLLTAVSIRNSPGATRTAIASISGNANRAKTSPRR